MPRVKRLPNGYVIRKGLLVKSGARADRYATAVHEAGHAVVAHLLGEKVQRVEVFALARAGMRGACWALYRKRFRRVDPVTRAVVAMAGHEAEHRICGRPMKLLPLGDVTVVRRLGCAESTVNIVGWLARGYVRRNVSAIRAVAHVLVERGALTRRQFLRAYREATA